MASLNSQTVAGFVQLTSSFRTFYIKKEKSCAFTSFKDTEAMLLNFAVQSICTVWIKISGTTRKCRLQNKNKKINENMLFTYLNL